MGRIIKISGERLKVAREKKGVNQNELAIVLGISQCMVSMIEQGTRNVKWHHVEKMCSVVGCTPELITEDGKPSPYVQIMRDVKRLSNNQVELVLNLIKELIKGQ